MFELLHRTPKSYEDLTPAQVREWLGEGRPLRLIDVRSPGEFARGHIKGALLIPLGELSARAGEIEHDAEVIVYCHSSARSRRAAELLSKLGYSHVYNMSGGVAAWPYGLKAS